MWSEAKILLQLYHSLDFFLKLFAGKHITAAYIANRALSMEWKKCQVLLGKSNFFIFREWVSRSASTSTRKQRKNIDNTINIFQSDKGNYLVHIPPLVFLILLLPELMTWSNNILFYKRHFWSIKKNQS